MIERVHAESPFAATASYSRAVRAGPLVVVSGTAATGPGGEILHPGDAYAQTRTVIERALAAADRLGAARDAIVHTRLYFTMEADWRSGVKAHGEIFAGVNPANTTVLVAGLPPEGALVEAELVAWVEPERGVA